LIQQRLEIVELRRYCLLMPHRDALYLRTRHRFIRGKTQQIADLVQSKPKISTPSNEGEALASIIAI
jgi:hypothetical protein